MDGTVRDLVLRAIAEQGPIPFDRFMEIALYGRGGYYERPPIGRSGDFVTSPHVHPWFALALASALGELQTALGPPVRLVEIGAGDGTLALQLLEILGDAGPLDYTAVERSAGALVSLRETGVRVAASIAELPPLEDALVFANELLDNLPFRRLRLREGRRVEVRVGANGGRLVEVEGPADRDLATLAPDLPEGGEAAVPTGALALVDELAGRLREGFVLLIDYSAERGGIVHGYRAHRVVADVLERPGTTDVTAPVDFDAVEARARDRGMRVLGRVTQREALLALGFGEWARRGRERSGALTPAGATRAWAARSRATLLVDPAGLGAHRWLLLATEGLEAPSWLERARRGSWA